MVWFLSFFHRWPSSQVLQVLKNKERQTNKNFVMWVTTSHQKLFTCINKHLKPHLSLQHFIWFSSQKNISSRKPEQNSDKGNKVRFLAVPDFVFLNSIEMWDTADLQNASAFNFWPKAYFLGFYSSPSYFLYSFVIIHATHWFRDFSVAILTGPVRSAMVGCHNNLLVAEEIVSFLWCYLYGTLPLVLQLT